jgi:hypothetical protein
MVAGTFVSLFPEIKRGAQQGGRLGWALPARSGNIVCRASVIALGGAGSRDLVHGTGRRRRVDLPQAAGMCGSVIMARTGRVRLRRHGSVIAVTSSGAKREALVVYGWIQQTQLDSATLGFGQQLWTFTNTT